MGMGYIKLPISFISLFENLTYAEIGRLVVEMFAFQQTNEEPHFETNDPLYFLWPMCRDNVLDSVEAYERQCAANRENGKRAADRRNPINPFKPKKPNGFSKTQPNRNNPN